MQFSLPLLFQLLLGLMTFAEKMKAPGVQKKELVLEGVKAAVPIIVGALPGGTAAVVADGARKADLVLSVASDAIDGLHAVMKKNNLYPEADAAISQASAAVLGVQAIVHSAFPADTAVAASG